MQDGPDGSGRGPAEEPDAPTTPLTPGPEGSDPAGGPDPTAGPGATILPAPRRSGRARAARLLSWTALVLGVVLVAGAGTGWGLYRHYGDKIGRLPGVGDLSSDQGFRPEDEVYLVVGSDSADGLTDAQLRRIGANRSQRDGTRTDTILLVQVPASGDRARVISFPRDSLVEIPGHGKNKINAAYDLGEQRRAGGGPGLLIDTVERISDLQVDHYVEVSLYSFVTITDAVGGVQVCLERPAQDRDANIDLPAGRQVLDGKDALAFVRQRKGLPDGDLSRIRRQQYFLGAMARKVLSAGTLLNPAKFNALLNAVVGSVKVDPRTTQSDLLQLGLQLRGVQAGSIKFETVPVLNPYGRYGQQSVVLLDEDALPDFFREGRSGGSGAVPRVTVPPASISVVVENGTRRAGLGGTAADDLRRVGFPVTAVRSAAVRDAAVTTVRYGSGRADSARTLVAALPGARLEADDALGASGLVVRVGEEYAGTRPVKVSRPRAPSAPSSEPRTAADTDCIR